MKNAAKITLLVADDHTLFRKGLVSLLQDFEDFGQILEAADGEQVLQLVAGNRPDVVLLDLKIPKLTGMEVLPVLLRLQPGIKVLVLTMHADQAIVATLMREGAHGYLLKDTGIEEVMKAIRTVAFSGENYTNKLVTDALLSQLRHKRVSNKEVGLGVELNKHEEVLLKLIVEQNTSAEIARKMNLGKRTIEGYRQVLMNKIGVKNTAGLVAFAIEHNLVLK